MQDEKYYFMQIGIEPTWGENETNIGKLGHLRKTKNVSLGQFGLSVLAAT